MHYLRPVSTGRTQVQLQVAHIGTYALPATLGQAAHIAGYALLANEVRSGIGGPPSTVQRTATALRLTCEPGQLPFSRSTFAEEKTP